MNRRSVGLAAVVVLIATSAVFGLGLEAGRQRLRWADVPWALLPLVFGVAGAAIMWKRPEKLVGRLLLLPALAWVLDSVAAWKLQSVDPETVQLEPGLYLAILADNLWWLLVLFPVFHLLLVFPTGRLPSRNWRWPVALEVAMIGLLVGLFLGSEVVGPMGENGQRRWTVEAPFGFLPPESFSSPSIGLSLLTLSLAGLAAVGVRYRRAGAVERHQIKWLLAGAGLFLPVYLTSGALNDALFGLALAAIPLSVMVAVLRYRLFEIDRLISRTLTYGLAAGLVAAVYAITVVGLTAVLPVGGSDLAVAGSTLAAFAAFRPARQATQAWIDRHFDRTHYDAARMVDDMADRLRHRLDLPTVTSALSGFARQSLQPSHVSI